MNRGAVTRRALALVHRHPAGIEAHAVAEAIGITKATACAILARLFWRGQVDRRKPFASKYLHTPRGPR